MDRIDRKIQSAARAVPAPLMRTSAGAKVGIVTIGGCHAACMEALDLLAAEGLAIDYLRVRGFPFADDVRGSSNRTPSPSSSSRIATRSSAAC